METREGEAAQTKRQKKTRSNGLHRAKLNKKEQHGNRRCGVRGQGGPGGEERAREGRRKRDTTEDSAHGNSVTKENSVTKK